MENKNKLPSCKHIREFKGKVPGRTTSQGHTQFAVMKELQMALQALTTSGLIPVDYLFINSPKYCNTKIS